MFFNDIYIYFFSYDLFFTFCPFEGGLRAMEWMGSKDCAWPTAFVFMKFNSLKPDLKNNYGSLMKVIR